MVSGPTENLTFNPNDPLIRHMLKVRAEHAEQQEKDYSHVFKPKTTFDLIRLSCIILGIELTYAAETAFVSPLLLQIGVEHQHMTMVWALAPLLGFFFAPLLGSLSDRCRLRLGRRRPMMIALCLCIIVGLIFIPYGKHIGLLLGDSSNIIPHVMDIYNITGENGTTLPTPDPEVTANINSHMFAIVFIILGTILIDFDVNISQTPCRAYILDVSIPTDHARALSTFTVMAGLGGTVGYILGGIDWETTSIGSYFGGNVQTVFAIVTFCFVICFCITATSFREIPLPLMEKDQLLRPLTAAAIKKELQKKTNGVVTPEDECSCLLSVASLSNLELQQERRRTIYTANTSTDKTFLPNSNLGSRSSLSHPVSRFSTNDNYAKALNNEPVKIIPGSIATLAAEDFNIAGSVPNIPEKQVENGNIPEIEEDEGEKPISLREYMVSIVKMPKAMRILCLTNLLCWMADVCYCLYFTDFVGEAVFHGSPTAPPNSEKAILYNEGVRFGCWGLAVYAFSCAIYSSFIEKLIKRLNTKIVYTVGILIFAIGMAVLAVWPTKIGVLVFSGAAGVIYSTMFTMPYLLVAQYHSHGCFKVKEGKNVDMTKPRGLGTDIAIVSSMAFIAQLIVSLGIGSVISWMQSTAAVLYTASTLAVLGAICALKCLYLA